MPNQLYGLSQLRTTIAAQRTQHIPGKALRVDAYQHLWLVDDMAKHERQVLPFVLTVQVQIYLKFALCCWDPSLAILVMVNSPMGITLHTG